MAPSFISRYLALFDATWTDDTPVDRIRFVVLDSEAQVPRRLLKLGARCGRTTLGSISEEFVPAAP